MRVTNIILLLGLLFVFSVKSKVRVCRSFSGYFINKGCSTTNEDDMEVPELIRKYGHNVLVYDVLTDDGYTLRMFRIPSENTPVLLQHSIYLSAATWVDSQNKSLAFALADAGYDVWLGNFRGTRYSRNHNKYTTNDPEFWNFSFHEMGIYDLPAQIKQIASVTGQAGNIIYIGYSTGTTASYVYGSTSPQEAAKYLKIIVSLAPLAYFKNIRSPLRFMQLGWNLVNKWLYVPFHGVFFDNVNLIKRIFRNVCFPFPSTMALCQLPHQFIGGFDLGELDPELLPVQTLQNLDSISFKFLGHLKQLIENGRFSFYDYGEKKNLRLYGSEHAPDYNLSAFKVPVSLVNGQNDLLSTKENVLRLYESLPDAVKTHGIWSPKREMFSHYDFVVARDARLILYDPLVEFLNELK